MRDVTRGEANPFNNIVAIDEEREQQLFNELLVRYEAAVCTSEQLATMDIAPRKFLMGHWMREGDLGFVYGWRGSGKTWFVNAIGTRIATGKDLEDWTVPEASAVLHVDGEMPFDDAKARILGMHKGNTLYQILHHDRLFETCGLSMNLTDTRTQKVLTALCIKRDIKLLILDNLSCLFSGMPENDADAWELVLNWLLDLRRRRIAVLIVHHASRSGTMRGTSKREDSVSYVIKVDEVKNRDDNDKGARFQTNFEKQRNSDSREWTREWTFQTESDGQISIGCTEISFDGKVLQLIQAGLSSASDIAEELNVAKSTVSKAAQRLLDKKLIETSGRQYKPRGFMKETKTP
jgi:RecA-family ATPase